MLFTVNRIPQLAVSAKLLCLLMVVICGVHGDSMVRSVRLHNDCSSSKVQVNLLGKVFASEELQEHDFSNLTLQSISFDKLTIFAERSRRYICFTRGWKLVGSKKFRGKRCEFEESMENGFNRYRSVANRNYSVGFNRKGSPLRGPKTVPIVGRKGKGLERCTYFSKFGVNLSESIYIHNRGDHHGPLKLPHIKSSGLNPLHSSSILPINNILSKIKKKKVPKLDSQSSPSTELIRHPQRHKNKNHLRFR